MPAMTNTERTALLPPDFCLDHCSDNSCFKRLHSYFRKLSKPRRYSFATWKRSITIFTRLPNTSLAAFTNPSYISVHTEWIVRRTRGGILLRNVLTVAFLR